MKQKLQLILFLTLTMNLFNSLGRAETMTQPQAKLNFVFLLCNDVDEIIKFYGDILGLEVEGSKEYGFASIKAGIEILFFEGDYPLEPHKEFAWQPGYQAASGHLTSFSFSFPLEQFTKAYQNAKEHKSPMLFPKPEWRKDSYWGITIQDPMGNTLELYSIPETKPDSLEWAD